MRFTSNPESDHFVAVPLQDKEIWQCQEYHGLGKQGKAMYQYQFENNNQIYRMLMTQQFEAAQDR